MCMNRSYYVHISDLIVSDEIATSSETQEQQPYLLSKMFVSNTVRAPWRNDWF